MFTNILAVQICTKICRFYCWFY